MNSLVNMLLNLFQIVAAASVFILFLWLLDRFVDLKHGHLWRKWFWGILCIRLLLPFPVHLDRFIDSGGIQVKVTVPVWHFLVVWLVGFLVLLRFRMSQHLHIKECYVDKSGVPEETELQRWMQKCREQQRLRHFPEIRIQEDAASPMLFGYFHPKLLVPPETYRSEELELVLKHELTHAKHGDLWYKLLILLVCDLYWFNPLFRLMKNLAFQDVEYVCDERVTKDMSPGERKAYGSVILKTMEDADPGNLPLSTQFAANQKTVKRRLGNLFTGTDLRRGIPVLAGLMIVFFISTACILVTEQKTRALTGGVRETAEELGQEIETVPTYLVDDLQGLHLKEDFQLENYYIETIYRIGSYYYIDEDHVLWGCGDNYFGQLGLGWQGEGVYEPEKIAENVVHVDFSGEYFAIFLTADGKLYGMGADPGGVMGPAPSPNVDPRQDSADTIVSSPVLLMEDVAYARCGYRHIAALKTDGSVWWWGQIQTGISRTGTKVYTSGQNGPVKVLEHARYVTSGNETMAAILEDDSLWMWGNNAVGNCGTYSDETDFILRPQKTAEQVKMVWLERFTYPEREERFLHGTTQPSACAYSYTTFIEKMDGSILACGLDVPGDQTRTMPCYYAELYDPQMLSFTEKWTPVFLRQKETCQ